MNYLLSSNSANFHLFAKMVASHTTINAADGLFIIREVRANRLSKNNNERRVRRVAYLN